jgi:pilus assembly protein CpaE
MRVGVQDFLSKPVNPTALREVLARFAQERGAAETEKVGGQRPIVILGAKGGVGATTVAVNLGVQLAQITKKRVVLLDLARPLGHSCLLLDLQPRFSIRNAIENVDRLDGHFLSGFLVGHKSGLEVLAGASHPDDWQQASVPSLARLVNVTQSTSDFVLMDCGTVYSSEWKTILGLARMVLLVIEARMPDICALAQHLSALGGLGLESERVRIIINRWHRRDEDTLKAVEKNLKRPIFACLPNDFRQVSEAINVGVPLSKNHNDPLTSKYRQLAGQLAGIPRAAVEKQGGLGSSLSLLPLRVAAV